MINLWLLPPPVVIIAGNNKIQYLGVILVLNYQSQFAQEII